MWMQWGRCVLLTSIHMDDLAVLSITVATPEAFYTIPYYLPVYCTNIFFFSPVVPFSAAVVSASPHDIDGTCPNDISQRVDQESKLISHCLARIRAPTCSLCKTPRQPPLHCLMSLQYLSQYPTTTVCLQKTGTLFMSEAR